MTTPRGTAAVVGLGLIGGSMARDLRRLGWRVLGYDRDAATLAAARNEAGIETLDELSGEALAPADLLVIALPVTAAVALLPALAPHLPPGCIVTDVGSTKCSIIQAAADSGLGARFVGSHPIAGDHRAGWGATREGLFSGARVFLTRTPETGEDGAALVEGLWRELGAVTEWIDAREHDDQVAWTSHLPQLVSSALAAALSGAALRPAQLGPGGRDVSRLAASSPDMWSAIAADNAGPIAHALTAFEAQLAELHDALESRDADRMHAFFSVGSHWMRGAPPKP